MKLLYAEAEPALSEAVVDYLTYHKYIVDAVYDGADAYDYAISGEYDGIILDIMMPKRDGLEVLSALRRDGCRTPILLLTAKTQVEDRIQGLDSGADDYLPKPFDMGELIARVRAMLRRREEFHPDSIQFGDLTLNMQSGTISAGEMSFPLPKQEYRMIEQLMLNHTMYLSSENLLIKAWGYDAETDITILETLVDAEGAFHKMDFDRPPPFVPPLDMDRMRSSRFFIVQSDADGNAIDVNIEQISSIDIETAQEYALTVSMSGKESGRIDGYKFAVKQLGPNQLIFFMDISGQRENFYMVLFVSGIIAVLCWLILLGIVILLSGKVIRPVLAGMEKQKQFITNAGHEMKTPLAIIQSNNDTMALIHGENKYNVHIRTPVSYTHLRAHET